MREIETFYWNRSTLNSGYIFFDDAKRAGRTKKMLTEHNFRFQAYITKGETNYYGFKIYGIKRCFLKFIRLLKEVLVCEKE